MPRFLPESDIEGAAQDLLLSFERKRGVIRHHVPLDDIVEQHLGIHLEFFDNTRLPARFHGEVLGYIDLQSNSIGIHESILPEVAGSEGRYNFTLGHEAGHYVLHREEILAGAAQFNCFEQEPTRYLAKTEQDASSREWQADCFSSYLIMPEYLIRQQWRDFSGSYAPMTLRAITNRFPDKVRRKFNRQAMAEMFLKEMAAGLRVSARALFIRLKKLGLIVEHEQLLMRL